jgi:hypothetical protein
MMALKKSLLSIFATILLAPLGFANPALMQATTKNVPEAKEPASTFPEGSLIKSGKSSSVWLIQGGQRHGIPDEKTLESKWTRSQVRLVKQSEIDAIPEGSPVPSVLAKGKQGSVPAAAAGSVPTAKAGTPPAVKDGSLIKSGSSSTVYLVEGGQRHGIPDEKTLESKGSRSQVQSLPENVVNGIPLGSPVPSVVVKKH